MPVTVSGADGWLGGGMALDISTGGMHLESAAELEVGKCYEIALSLDGGAPMTLQIEVTRRDGDSGARTYGVRFEQLSADDICALFEYASA